VQSLIINGYLSLQEDQRKEVFKIITEFENGDDHSKSITKLVNKIEMYGIDLRKSLGPLASTTTGCPCCGK
jgi:hypothetical protein